MGKYIIAHHVQMTETPVLRLMVICLPYYFAMLLRKRIRKSPLTNSRKGLSDHSFLLSTSAFSATLDKGNNYGNTLQAVIGCVEAFKLQLRYLA